MLLIDFSGNPLLTVNYSLAQAADSIDVKPVQPEKSRVLPFGADWAKKKVIDLPGYIKLKTIY